MKFREALRHMSKGITITKNYKLRKDLSIEHNGYTLYRIECIRAFDDIEVGTLGGYVESYNNLKNNAWAYDDAKIYGKAVVCRNATIFGNAQVCDDARVYDNANIFANAVVFGNAIVHGDACVSSNARVCGDELKKESDICYISNRHYDITITPLYIRIGCQYHSQKTWWNFNDKQIEKMDGKNALDFWKIWKEPLKQICKAMKTENNTDKNN